MHGQPCLLTPVIDSFKGAILDLSNLALLLIAVRRALLCHSHAAGQGCVMIPTSRIFASRVKHGKGTSAICHASDSNASISNRAGAKFEDWRQFGQQDLLVLYIVAAFAQNPKTLQPVFENLMYDHSVFIHLMYDISSLNYLALSFCCCLTCCVPGNFIPALMNASHPHQLSNELRCQHDLIHTHSILMSGLIPIPAHELFCFWARRLSLLC